MRREGVREQYVAAVLADEEEIDPEDVAEVVAIQTSPREIVTPPTIAAASEASIELGKQLYATQTCDSCHGASGTGDENTPLFDDLGRPAYPRDLVHEYFKGGNTADSIYMRIQLGMPGSPHPANVGLSDQEDDRPGALLPIAGQGPQGNSDQPPTRHSRDRAAPLWRS